MYCASCNSTLEGAFCSRCGTKASSKMASNDDTQHYCSACGALSTAPLCVVCRAVNATDSPFRATNETHNHSARNAQLAIIGATFLPGCLGIYMLIMMLFAKSFSDFGGTLCAGLCILALCVAPPLVTLVTRSWKARRATLAGSLFWSLLIALTTWRNTDHGGTFTAIAVFSLPVLILMWLKPVQQYVDDYSATWFLLMPRQRTLNDKT